MLTFIRAFSESYFFLLEEDLKYCEKHQNVTHTKWANVVMKMKSIDSIDRLECRATVNLQLVK